MGGQCWLSGTSELGARFHLCDRLLRGSVVAPIGQILKHLHTRLPVYPFIDLLVLQQ